ncbi:MAG: methyltransferase domain-containing protein [Burkholderiales bacterium]|nr:methyltransferase domain-containing protein [Burkholderiales bacterium]
MLNDIAMVKRKFSNAAKNYLANADIQKNSALEIISKFTQYYELGTVLDLGSGVGTFKHQQKIIMDNAILFDLSLGMLKESGNKNCINGSASHIPILSNSVNTIISNLMIQWVSDKTQVLKEINRILNPNGYVILSTLVKPSLNELQIAWQEVDSHQHTLTFDTIKDYESYITKAGLKIIESITWQNTLYFSDVYELMHHFKKTGTNTRKEYGTAGLSGKEKIKSFTIVYEKQRVYLGLPLSYQYLIIVAKKELL